MTKRILVLVALLATALAWGQRSPERYPVYLLLNPAVQQDMHVSAATGKKAAKIMKDAQAWYMRQITPAGNDPNVVRQPDYATVQKHNLETESQIVALLTSAQKTRLRQIGLQYVGAFALSDPQIANQLKIMPGQQTKLREAGKQVRDDFNKEVRKLTTNEHLQPGKIQDPKKAQAKIAAAQVAMLKALAAKVAKILTPQQLAKWKQMQGAPFAIESLFTQGVRRV